VCDEKRPTFTKIVILPYPTPYPHLHLGNFTVLHVFGAVLCFSLLQEARNSRIQTPCIACRPIHPTAHTLHYTRPTPYNTRHPTLHQQPLPPTYLTPYNTRHSAYLTPYHARNPGQHTPYTSFLTLRTPHTLHLISHTAHTPHPTTPNTLPTSHPTFFSPYTPYTLQCPTPCL